MYKFIKTPDPDNRFDHSTIQLSFDGDMTLECMLEEVASFLRACGYSIDGELEVVKEEDTSGELEAALDET